MRLVEEECRGEKGRARPSLEEGEIDDSGLRSSLPPATLPSTRRWRKFPRPFGIGASSPSESPRTTSQPLTSGPIKISAARRPLRSDGLSRSAVHIWRSRSALSAIPARPRLSLLRILSYRAFVSTCALSVVVLNNHYPRCPCSFVRIARGPVSMISLADASRFEGVGAWERCQAPSWSVRIRNELELASRRLAVVLSPCSSCAQPAARAVLRPFVCASSL